MAHGGALSLSQVSGEAAGLCWSRFPHKEIRQLVRDVEKQAAVKGGRAHVEAVIQDRFDQFIFAEGFTPITHVVAQRGTTDTIMDDLGEDSHLSPPLLVELKQCVSVSRARPVTHAEVAQAIAEAKVQVATYWSGLSVRRRWGGLVPFVVVFHTCSQDLLDLHSPQTVLVDIGDRRPSTILARSQRARKSRAMS